MLYRNLTKSEIKELESNGCKAAQWPDIKVAEPFNASRISNVTFYGSVQIGKLDDRVEYSPGVARPSGIKNSSISDCKLGHNVYINNVTNLANYDIGEEVILEDIGSLFISGKTSFGNGSELEILNEGGGRELPIFENLNAQLAYILVNYQHDSKLIEKLHKMIDQKIKASESDRGKIADNVQIKNTTWIENVNIGNSTKIIASKKLLNGTIISNAEDPVQIDNCALAENFIIQEGSYIGTDAVIDNCFIGQSVKIDKQFSAENSAFFANSGFFHGEGCSVFAGPYTVSHHKSSLLIAGMFSFYNAGSGTNQSNHMYKLGPVHQGILERGCKTGSFSYLLWPSRVGAFSAVMGKHTDNFDVSDFPFSYVEKIDGKSTLSPAMNLITVGTLRDSRKWPKRDKRKSNKRDLINFALFSPYTIGKILKGRKKIEELYENASKKQKYITYSGVKIKRLLLRAAKKYYKIPIRIFIGDQLLKQMENKALKSIEDIQTAAAPKMSLETKWIDIFGMLAPYYKVEDILDDIKNDKIEKLEDILDKFADLHREYEQLTWQWTVSLMEEIYNKDLAEISKDELIEIIQDWKDNKLKLNKMILRDADKEFDKTSQIGYGIDGDEETVEKDFTNVRGKMEDNSFVKSLRKESQEVEAKAEQYIKTLQK
jgi:hypothetical protein